jgi:hypothetical protein
MKSHKSNWQFDSQPQKVRYLLDLFALRWHAKYCWKALNKGYNFTSNLTLIKGFHKTLSASKVVEVLVSVFSKLPILKSHDKMTYGCKAMARHRKYYKGEGDGVPQV